MFVVHINAAGIEQVHVISSCEAVEDLTLAAWPMVRKQLQILDKKLKRAAKIALQSGQSAPKERL